MDLCAMTRKAHSRRTRPFKQDQLHTPPVALTILHRNQFPVNHRFHVFPKIVILNMQLHSLFLPLKIETPLFTVSILIEALSTCMHNGSGVPCPLYPLLFIDMTNGTARVPMWIRLCHAPVEQVAVMIQ